MQKTNIGYLTHTWNPIVGCSKASEGCTNCWAEKMANRLSKIPATADVYSQVITDGKWNGKTTMNARQFSNPDFPSKPARIGVCWMGDLFHEAVPFEWQYHLIEYTLRYPQHQFFLLTKRPATMAKTMETIRFHFWRNYPPEELKFKNVWFGTSIENQKTANERIPELLKIPSPNLYVSIEPMLGPVDLTEVEYGNYPSNHYDALKGRRYWHGEYVETVKRLSWVILGGESGPKARPLHPDWVRSVRDQCQAAGVPFWFKQHGEYLPAYDAGYRSDEKDRYGRTFGKVWSKNSYRFPDGQEVVRVGKHAAGNLLDGKKYEELPG